MSYRIHVVLGVVASLMGEGLLQARIIWHYALVVTLQRTGKPK